MTSTAPDPPRPHLEVFEGPPTRRVPLADKLVWFGVGTTVVLGGIHAGLELTWRFRHAIPAELREVFLINQEQSIATWLTVFMTALLGLLCLSRGLATRRRGWYVVGGLFLYLSMDDATMLHERVGWIANGQLGDGFSFRWVQVLGPVFAVAGLLAFAFLWREFRGCTKARLRMLAAFAMLGSSLVVEVFEKFFTQSGMRFRGLPVSRYTIWLEECAELLAPALLLSCLVGLHEVGCGTLHRAQR